MNLKKITAIVENTHATTNNMLAVWGYEPGQDKK